MSRILINIVLDSKEEFRINTNSDCISISFDSVEKLEQFYCDNASILTNEKFINKLVEEGKCTSEEIIEKIKSNDFDISSVVVKSGTCFTADDITKVVSLLKDNSTLNIEDLDIDEINEIIVPADINDEIIINTTLYESDSCCKKELDGLCDYLYNIKKFISKYDLSPLEACIFVYDLVRERDYNENSLEIDARNNELLSEGEEFNMFMNATNSRTLNKIYKSDKIVCAGFSALYKAILRLLNIDSYMLLYEPAPDSDMREGHISNVVYLNDNKYNVKGLFEVDTTWGRFGSELYNYTLNNYIYFARNLNDAYSQKKAIGLVPGNLDFYDNSKTFFKEDSRVDKFDDTELDLKTFKKALYKVRIIEHSIDKDKYKITENMLDAAAKTRSVFTEDEVVNILCKNNSGNDIYRLSEKEKLEIARSELISILHKVSNDGINKNPVLSIRKRKPI